MANMSYCMFENTYNDLTQCYQAIADAVNDGELAEFLANMSTYERDAFHRMRSLVNDMVEAYDAVGDIR